MKRRIATIQELLNIPIIENGEPMEELHSSKDITASYLEYGKDMNALLQGRIFVRKNVRLMLKEACRLLKMENPYLRLNVAYGYRSLEIQTKYFLNQLQLLVNEQPESTAMKIMEETHRRCAFPPVGGHVTGGAIDITLFDLRTKQEVPMGCPIGDFGQLSYFEPDIKLKSEWKSNRQLLRDIMENVGFAPFDGEWWHFSYGDREWAAWQNKTKAIYGPIQISEVLSLL